MRKIALTLLMVVAAATARAADNGDNWPHWRGPLANGMAPNGDPPITWDEHKNVKWKTPIPGKGAATPIVWDDKVFVLTAMDTGREAAAADLPKADPNFEKKTKPPTTYYQFLVYCIDRKNGQVRWKQIAAEQPPHEGHHQSTSYAAGSPTTDGRFLYVSFGSRGLFCYDLEGKLIWKRDLGLMHTRLGWGEGLSPVIHGDTLIMNWDHEDKSFIVALDAHTGKTRWKMDRDEKSSWATPLVIPYQGKTQVVVSATNKVRSYDLATGEVIWQCGGQTVNVIPSPVLFGDFVVCLSGYRGSFACAIPLASRGDVTDKVMWTYTGGTPYVPSPLLSGDRLYFTHLNNAILSSLDVRTGKPIIDRARLPGLTSLYASPTGTPDRIYIADRDGTTLVLKRSDKLEILAINKLAETIDASPVIVGKQLFLRGEKHLYCIESQ